MVKNITK